MKQNGSRSLAVLVVVGLVVVAGCSSSSGTSSPTSTSSTVAVSTTVGLTANLGRTWGVGRAEIALSDPTRDAVAKDGTVHHGRALPTVVLYPTATPGDDASNDDHPVAPGRFPLLVFSHGVTASGPAYVPVLRKVAAAGFIVALPTYPLTSGPKGWSNLSDVQNQPADVSFIITKVFQEADQTGTLLHGHLDPAAVAVGGHSLGAITSLLFANSCCRDKRVKAIVAVSGALFPAKDKSDSFDDPPTDLPIEMLHGEKDTTVPYRVGSRHVFDTLTQVPRALVSFPDAGHVNILGSASAIPAIIAFLDLELRHDPTEWKKLDSLLATNGDAKIEVGGGLVAPN